MLSLSVAHHKRVATLAKLTYCDALATPIYEMQPLTNFATSVNHGCKMYIN